MCDDLKTWNKIAREFGLEYVPVYRETPKNIWEAITHHDDQFDKIEHKHLLQREHLYAALHRNVDCLPEVVMHIQYIPKEHQWEVMQHALMVDAYAIALNCDLCEFEDAVILRAIALNPHCIALLRYISPTVGKFALQIVPCNFVTF